MCLFSRKTWKPNPTESCIVFLQSTKHLEKSSWNQHSTAEIVCSPRHKILIPTCKRRWEAAVLDVGKRQTEDGYFKKSNCKRGQNFPIAAYQFFRVNVNVLIFETNSRNVLVILKKWFPGTTKHGWCHRFRHGIIAVYRVTFWIRPSYCSYRCHGRFTTLETNVQHVNKPVLYA